jgi:hypothetical protein
MNDDKLVSSLLEKHLTSYTNYGVTTVGKNMEAAIREAIQLARAEAAKERQLLLSALIKRQELGWSFCKEMRDTFDQLAMRSEHALDEMQKAGMETHLPTIDEMMGLFNKSDAEIAKDVAAAAERVRKSAAGE